MGACVFAGVRELEREGARSVYCFQWSDGYRSPSGFFPCACTLDGLVGGDTRVDVVASATSTLRVATKTWWLALSPKVLEKLWNASHESVELTAAGCSPIGQREGGPPLFEMPGGRLESLSLSLLTYLTNQLDRLTDRRARYMGVGDSTSLPHRPPLSFSIQV